MDRTRSELMLTAYFKNDSGAAAMEFIMIASVMALVLIAVMPLIAGSTTSSFSSLAGHISTGT